MKKVFLCVVMLFVFTGCVNELSPQNLIAIRNKAEDSKKGSELFNIMNPKIKAQLKEDAKKAAIVKYLDDLRKKLENDAKSDKNIWNAIRDQHSK